MAPRKQRKQDKWIPKKSQVELLRVYAGKADTAQKAFKDKLAQVALEVGISEEEWTSGAIQFDWEQFQRRPLPVKKKEKKDEAPGTDD